MENTKKLRQYRFLIYKTEFLDGLRENDSTRSLGIQHTMTIFSQL
jgi:hypothetical protein